ncbi:hypothetical protein [Nannocystis sp.]|nr:hypothetical protein [Nannocystis sp.]MBK7830219.1 hypothetical protein [Nannocystis sp.]
MPFSGIFLMFGTFALLGFAPFGSFVGELVMMGGMIEAGQTILFSALCLILLIVFVATGRSMFPMIWATHPRAHDRHRESVVDLAPKALFLLLLFTLGIYMPTPLNDLLRQVAHSLGGLP